MQKKLELNKIEATLNKQFFSYPKSDDNCFVNYKKQEKIQKTFIGCGSYGQVSKIQFAGKKFALKQIKTQNQTEMELCLRQAKILQTCFYHPNIVKYVTSFQKDSIFFIVMEYVEGPTLQSKILELYETFLLEKISQNLENKSIGNNFELQIHFSVKYYDVLISYIIQIVLAIHHLKKLNVIHRDIKPANILIDSKKNLLKIVDFGVSKRNHNQQSLTQSEAGTPMFMAPEMLLQKNYGQKVDIWSLGVIIYQMCHEYAFPFKSKNKKQLMKKFCQMNLFISQQIHPNLNILLRGCLQKDPKKRFSTQDILNLEFVKEWMKKSISSKNSTK